MPTYTYRCKKCGHEHMEFHTMSAAPRVHCGVCKGVCEKQIGSGAGIIFKGSGFYETDYKKKSGTPEGGAAGKVAENSGEKTSEKAGEKAAAPAAAKAPAASDSSKKESKGGKAAGSGKD